MCSPYGELISETLHRVLCPDNHPGRCDLTGQNVTQDQLMFPPNKLYERVYLDRNKFQSVLKGTFDNQPEIIYLTLERNQITAIDQYMLQKLSKLKFFNIAHNYVFSIHPEAFMGTLILISLVLNNNHLLQFPPEVFCYLKHLHELDLHNNNLKTFESLSTRKPENLARLTLSGNPLCCDGRMAWIKERERLDQIRWGAGPDNVLLTPTCVNFQNRHWFDISDWELWNGE